MYLEEHSARGTQEGRDLGRLEGDRELGMIRGSSAGGESPGGRWKDDIGNVLTSRMGRIKKCSFSESKHRDVSRN